MSNSKKKLVCPSTSGTESDWHHANASLAPWTSPKSAARRIGMAASWEIPATRIVALFGSHTNPRLVPTLQGSTLTSAPLSTNAGASIWRPLARSVSGSIGRCLGSYGKRMMISRAGRGLQQLVQFIRRSRLKMRSLQLVGHAMLQRMNKIPIINFNRQKADQFKLVGCWQQSSRRHDFIQSHSRIIHGTY
jgi:hypothetical protein